MDNLESLRRELDALRLRLEELEKSRGVLTFDALYSLRRDIDALNERMNSQEMKQTPPGFHVPRKTPAFFGKMPAGNPTPPVEKSIRGKFSEANIGKYGAGVLAAILILLAVAVAAGSFWWLLPAAVKFLIIFLAGAAMTAAGEFFLLTRDEKNGFWQSVAGCGAGVTFSALASGAAVWSLYGTAAAGILFLLWFSIHNYLSYRNRSRVFYAISYAGGILSVCLAVLSAGEQPGVSQQAELAAIISAVLAIGLLGNRKRQDRFLWLLNTLFCLLSVLATNRLAFGGLHILSVTRAVLCFLALLCVQPVFPSGALLPMALRGAATFLFALGFSNLVLEIDCSLIGHSLCLLALAAAWFALGRKGPLSAGLASVCALLIGNISFELSLPASLLPLLASAVLFTFPAARRDIWNRLAALLFYLPGFLSIETEREAAAALLCALAAVLPPSVDYGFQTKFPGAWSLTERTAMVILASAGLWEALPSRRHIEPVILLVSVLVMLTHQYLAVRKSAGKQNDTRTAEALCAGCLLVFHFMVYVLMVFADKADAVILSVSLVAMSAMAVYDCITRNDSTPVTVGTVVLCQLNLWRAVTGCAGRDVALFAAVLGLFLSAGFISLGFCFRKKKLRMSGLVSMIVYVVWSAWSVSFRHGSAAAAAMLLLGGLACFGISFAYNRLSQIFDAQEESEN